jgi:hypothetical protein
MPPHLYAQQQQQLQPVSAAPTTHQMPPVLHAAAAAAAAPALPGADAAAAAAAPAKDTPKLVYADELVSMVCIVSTENRLSILSYGVSLQSCNAVLVQYANCVFLLMSIQEEKRAALPKYQMAV